MSNCFTLSFSEIFFEHPDSELQLDNSILNPLSVNTLPQDTLRHRPPYILPTFGNSAQDMDNLDDVNYFFLNF